MSKVVLPRILYDVESPDKRLVAFKRTSKSKEYVSKSDTLFNGLYSKFEDAKKHVLEKLQEELKELQEEIEYFENLKRDDCPTSDDPYC